MLLPKTKSAIVSEMSRYTFLFYGERKIGKTAVASQFTEPLFLMTEPGGKALSIYQTQVKNWTNFCLILDELEKDNRFQTLVIDTAGRLYNLCYDYILETYDIETPQEEVFGQGWHKIQKEFEKQNDRIFYSSRGALIIAHSEIVNLYKKGGITESYIKVELPKQAKRYYAGIVNTIIYFHYNENGDRVMTIRGRNNIEAGTQIKKRFLYPDGEEIKDIPMGKDEEEAFRNLCLAFDNKLEKPKRIERKILIK